MREPDWENIGCSLVVIAAVLFLIYAVVFMAIAFNTEEQCARLGWRDNKVTWNLSVYCVREENEYEIIRPLSEIRREGEH